MGFATKLAASQAGPGGAPPYPGGPSPSQPPGGQQPYGGQQSQSQQYQAYPGSQSVMGKFSRYTPGAPSSSDLSVPTNNYSGGQYGQPPIPPHPNASPQRRYQSPQYAQQNYNTPYSSQPSSGYPGSVQHPYPPSQWNQQSHSTTQYSSYGPPQGPLQGQSSYGQAQQGYQPQGGQQQYGNAPPSSGGTQNIAVYKGLMEQIIQQNRLQAFYPPGSPALDRVAQQAGQKVQTLLNQWRIPREIGNDIVKLALYDVILYIDDSGSMAFESDDGGPPGERIHDLKAILHQVAFATSLLDEDGIQVRFMNSTVQGNGIRSQQQVEQLVSQVRFSGLTPLAREMQNKILGPLVLQPARAGQLQKPVCVITITDGEPAGEQKFDIVRVIKTASEELSRTKYGKGAVTFQFAQVGKDLRARDFLSKLDEEPSIGDIIDCTSTFEVEQDEMSRAVPPVDLTPELYLVKLLLGSIDSTYDTQDEKTGNRPPPQQQGYGSYGGPQQGYLPQQQQYGGNYGGAPPQQGYGQQPQSYGQQVQGYGQQAQGPGVYNRPPPGQGYPLQQGGYGPGPPPPPRY